MTLTESGRKAVPVNVLEVYRADQWYISIYYQPRQQIQMRGKFTLHTFRPQEKAPVPADMGVGGSHISPDVLEKILG